MITPGSANALLLAQGGYQIQNSLRFRASNSAYLSRTSGASPTDQKKVTYSAWMKAAPTLSSSTQVALVGSASNNGMIAWNIVSFSGRLFIRTDSLNDIQFAGLFRDPSAWGHLVISIDTTQATAADRVKAYWNGTAMTYSSGSYPAQNSSSYLNAASTAYRIMSDIVNGTYLDGYLANVYMIDGQALTPSSFGQTDAATGVWVPKAYSGTYGTNGFFLQFKDATSTTTIGYDTSGNSNNFTTSGISVTAGATFDQMLDTPTNNYCTLNPVNPTYSTASSANLNVSIPFNINSIVKGSIAVSFGKWYWETTIESPGVGAVGVLVDGAQEGYYPGYSLATGISYESTVGQVRQNGVIATYNSFTTNDVIGVALDMDNGKIFFSKNGTWQGSSDPVAGTNPASSTGISGKTWNVANGNNSASTAVHTLNFGQRAFTYTPPSGFKALNTANITAPSIKKPSLYMDATLRTGTGATASVASLGFQPDLVWIKSRSAATNHNMFDSGRGVQKGLGTNWSGAQYTDANTLTAFNSNGYSIGSDASSRGVNINTNTYVDWAWKKGATPGFDVVTYTGNATNRTISHGLGAVPEMMLIRNYDWASTQVMVAYHSRLNGGTTPANYYLYTTSTAAETTNAAFFNNTTPTSSVFTVGTDTFVNRNGDGHVAYLFTSVNGFSKFGSYVGNGSTDGPFVWCGFRPAFVMVKCRDSDLAGSAHWVMQDAKRSPMNAADEILYANLTNSVGTSEPIDFLSNGFKIRNTVARWNSSGSSFIFAAFAEAPFKYARAR